MGILDGVHTIPVPACWTLRQAWDAYRQADPLPQGQATWQNITVKDGEANLHGW